MHLPFRTPQSPRSCSHRPSKVQGQQYFFCGNLRFPHPPCMPTNHALPRLRSTSGSRGGVRHAPSLSPLARHRRAPCQRGARRRRPTATEGAKRRIYRQAVSLHEAYLDCWLMILKQGKWRSSPLRRTPAVPPSSRTGCNRSSRSNDSMHISEEAAAGQDSSFLHFVAVLFSATLPEADGELREPHPDHPSRRRC